MLTTLLTCFSAAAFLVYGVLCLTSMSMVDDFRRFGLEHLRMLTGLLEVLGGTGLLVGLRWRPALLFASGGLALLMLIAFAVRLRMKDSFLLSLPSALFMLLNVFLLFKALKH